MTIAFHSEDVNFNLKHKTVVKNWIIATIEEHNEVPGDINLIFCSDDFLLKLNQDHLKHDTYTDIITFDYTKDHPHNKISADIYISVKRVEENANLYKKSFENELHRVIIHGTLHLLGYKDKGKEHKEAMTAKEDACLLVFEKMKRKIS